MLYLLESPGSHYILNHHRIHIVARCTMKQHDKSDIVTPFRFDHTPLDLAADCQSDPSIHKRHTPPGVMDQKYSIIGHGPKVPGHDEIEILRIRYHSLFVVPPIKPIGDIDDRFDGDLAIQDQGIEVEPKNKVNRFEVREHSLEHKGFGPFHRIVSVHSSLQRGDVECTLRQVLNLNVEVIMLRAILHSIACDVAIDLGI